MFPTSPLQPNIRTGQAEHFRNTDPQSKQGTINFPFLGNRKKESQNQMSDYNYIPGRK